MDLLFQDHPDHLRHIERSLFRTAEARDDGVMRIELKLIPSVACVATTCTVAATTDQKSLPS
jgi:hypothetical protein